MLGACKNKAVLHYETKLPDRFLKSLKNIWIPRKGVSIIWGGPYFERDNFG